MKTSREAILGSQPSLCSDRHRSYNLIMSFIMLSWLMSYVLRPKTPSTVITTTYIVTSTAVTVRGL